MKKVLPLVLAIPFFSIFASVYATAEIKKTDFSLSVEPLIGVKNGQVNEYVFLKESNYDCDKLSELNWEIKNEFYSGLKLNGGYKNIFLEAGFTAGFPLECGTMKDSDWYNNDPTLVTETSGHDYKTNYHDYKTNYSESDNYIDYDISASLKTGYSFKLPELKKISTKISPFFEFEYQLFKFTAKNGTAWYGSETDGYYAAWNDEENRSIKYFSGDVISYKRQNFIFWLGGSIAFNLPKDFSVGAGFKFSPFVYSEAIDCHHLRGLYFLDIVSDFCSLFNYNFHTEYKIDSKKSICLNADYLYMKTLRGKSYSSDSQKWSKDNELKDSEGGADQHCFNISLSFKYNFF